MARRYVFVRLPAQVYNRYLGINRKQRQDVRRITGKDIPITMVKTFRSVVDPKLNENYIEIDSKNLVDLAKEKRRRWS